MGGPGPARSRSVRAHSPVRVAALTSGENVPSSRFRVRQHIEPLAAHGVHVREYIPAIDKYAPPATWARRLGRGGTPPLHLWESLKLATRAPGLVGSWRGQITWLERELFPGRLTLEPLLKRPLVLDVDDAIWLASPRAEAATIRLARLATVVAAGNRYLADWFSRYAAEVRIIPTAVDTTRFAPAAEPPAPRDRFVIGWTGSRATLPYLEAIEQPLAHFLGAHPDAELLVVADHAPHFRDIDPTRIRFVPWSPDTEASTLREMDVGVMPLPDDEWTRGKCSFKMLQYMACALPVVVSPVGLNQEILATAEVGLGARTDREWNAALAALYADRSAGRALGERGRQTVLQRFSRAVVASFLAEIFHSVGQKISVAASR
jgi:glycosyltransferase involved in cell wall biosynthesis